MILQETRTALDRIFPGENFDVRPMITFGSWIGGDRDGHPFVTTEVTEADVPLVAGSSLRVSLVDL